MDNELDRFAREMEHGLQWLLKEVKRLRTENKRLLAENQELRQELTVMRLDENMQSGIRIRETSLTDHSQPADLTPKAMQFYEGLPDNLSFADYFQFADSEEISGDEAREYMLIFVRKGMLQQRGRKIEKRPTFTPLAPPVESY